ncbi:phenoloxidase-activating factor 3 [Bicyclus anynana]|uniref:CLIP domain-containing serine protease n=1 Tax=Bicyclus anynana TaxID=110368 RepID=A0A6J1MLE8_BICAN|nr:phenoloxidase-activating factor 3 [Bicyclus anynana]XP_052742397.1 phenoloxidase-activating factor 3 [Bicyclus anynana]
MVTLKVLLFIFVLSNNRNLFTFAQTRRCFDCVSVTSCEIALDYARMIRVGTLPNESRQVFMKAICGFDPYNRMPKVCCSDFPVVNTKTRGGIPEEDSNLSAESIENHRNVGLLPLHSCGDIDGARITGGEFAKLYEYPWMTLIAYNTTTMGQRFLCGGSIINSRYILTAAHCVILNGKFQNIAGVRIGELDYSTDTDCQGHGFNMICETKVQDIDVEEIIPHENFNELNKSAGGDIALLRLSEPIIMYNNAAPICLPLYDNLRTMSLAGLRGTVAGWGTMENNVQTTKLMKVEIPIKSRDECISSYRSPTVKTFCAGAMKKDSCSGDSGGPFMVESDFNGTIRLVQYGVVSFGKKCGDHPGVYTDVSKYMDWILDHIKE